MRLCRTGVEIKDAAGNHIRFENCGLPTVQAVMVGVIECHFCLEHAAEARRYVESQGVEKITSIQQRIFA